MLSEVQIEQENKEIVSRYKDLLRTSYQTLSEEDKAQIRLAFEVAVDAHKNQRRKSGEAYVFHPIAVAQIVAEEIGLDAVSIIAALLHDVVEDTHYTLDYIEEQFGPTVARIVDGLTKIAGLKKDTNDYSLQAENFRKMLLTLNDDVRVILIKIADRYHNMLTLESMRPDKRVKIASETLYIYAPLAHRVGLFNIKNTLEDLALKYTEPSVYSAIQKNIVDSADNNVTYIEDFKSVIKDALERESIAFQIKGRMKSIHSIHKKMLSQNVSFDQIYDKFAVRIIYKAKPEEEKFLAWKIYSIITDYFTPNPVRLRDWITSPKSTGYEALHITVMGPDKKWVEVQIRSDRMHEIAEKGYAAHYKYKHGEQKEVGIETWLNRLQEALESANGSAVDFVEEFKLNLYSKEIFVFTPKGDLISLPKGATPLDFAFHVHTEVGIKTRGARVNGKLVPLSSRLKSGDQVEIITSDNAKPTTAWLDYCHTAKALSKIRSSLNAEKKSIAEEGREVLRRKLRSQKIKFNEETINRLVNHFKLKTSQDLFYRIGSGAITNSMIKTFASSYHNALISFFTSRIRRSPKEKPSALEEGELSQQFDMLVFGEEEERLNYTLASDCCKPIPGDEVFGFLTVNDGIKVHKKNCPNALSMQSKFSYRIMQARWIDSTQEDFFADINITGIDQLGLVSSITQVISQQMHVGMKSISFTEKGGTFSGSIRVIVKNNDILNSLIKKLRQVNGVDKVIRT
ncbi:MAG: RelA/SpoT family protein [Bacteroidetes bacterium]|nr:RelA/SpoT family protein [Bacteroidota bacterium]